MGAEAKTQRLRIKEASNGSALGKDGGSKALVGMTRKGRRSTIIMMAGNSEHAPEKIKHVTQPDNHSLTHAVTAPIVVNPYGLWPDPGKAADRDHHDYERVSPPDILSSSMQMLQPFNSMASGWMARRILPYMWESMSPVVGGRG